MAVNGICA